MIARLAELLLARTARERRLLALLAAVALPAAVVFGILLPLGEASTQAAAEAEEARALRDWVSARAAEAPATGEAETPAPVTATEPIGISRLDQSLRDAGLRPAVDQLANRGDGEVELGFDDVRFTAFAAWMDANRASWGYEIATLRLDRGSAGDLVSARMVLRPAEP